MPPRVKSPYASPSSTFTMFSVIAATLLLAQCAFAAPVANAAAATVGKIRGVQSPIYHLYLQANPQNGISIALMMFYLWDQLMMIFSFDPRNGT